MRNAAAVNMWLWLLNTIVVLAASEVSEDDFISVYSERFKGYYLIRDTGELVSDPRVRRDFVPGDNIVFDALSAAFPSSLLNITPVTGILNALGANPLELTRDTYPLPKGLEEPLDEYDYVVIGAGSAGSVVASRLSENKKDKVLLLDIGKPESVFTDIPLLAPLLSFTEYTEPYYMERQEGVCKAMNNQRCFWPRGRAVGGTSVINYMLYTRGTKMDWDNIAADGNYGWSYDEVLPYFKKSEKSSLKDLKDSPFHSSHGLLDVSDVPFRSKLAATNLEAYVVLGNRLIDYNSDEGVGCSYLQVNLRNGRRCSTAKAFLHPFKRRKNLHILPESRALKINIDEDRVAHSVDYIWKEKKRTVTVRKEIILSAGPMASPQLLMLSGVGPKYHLRDKGIKVIKDLPVGEILYDHISYPGQVYLVNKTGITVNLMNSLTPMNFARYSQFNEGPITMPVTIESLGYITTDAVRKNDPFPDIELVNLDISVVSDGGIILASSFNMALDYYNQVYSPKNFADSFSIVPLLLQPKSRGHLKLKDANPMSHPLLFGNYLTERQDVEAFISALRYMDELVLSEPYKKFGVSIYKPKLPTCPNATYGSDEYFECAVRSVTYTVHHQISTCKMGPADDPEAVVDPELRVYGIKNLRVVDSSIIPRPTAAHTSAPAVMIGEKAADMIKATWEDREY